MSIGDVMTVVREAGGAQVLPSLDDPRATVTSWTAHCCCDADIRTKRAALRNAARSLFVFKDAGAVA